MDGRVLDASGASFLVESGAIWWTDPSGFFASRGVQTSRSAPGASRRPQEQPGEPRRSTGVSAASFQKIGKFPAILG